MILGAVEAPPHVAAAELALVRAIHILVLKVAAVCPSVAAVLRLGHLAACPCRPVLRLLVGAMSASTLVQEAALAEACACVQAVPPVVQVGLSV